MRPRNPSQFAACFLPLWDVVKRDSQGVSHAFSISRIGFYAVADMANLNLSRSGGHGTGRIGEERFLFFRTHQSEKHAGLGVVIVVNPMVLTIGISIQTERWFRKLGLLSPLTMAIRLVTDRAAMVAVDSHGTIAVVTVERTA